MIRYIKIDTKSINIISVFLMMQAIGWKWLKPLIITL